MAIAPETAISTSAIIVIESTYLGWCPRIALSHFPEATDAVAMLRRSQATTRMNRETQTPAGFGRQGRRKWMASGRQIETRWLAKDLAKLFKPEALHCTRSYCGQPNIRCCRRRVVVQLAKPVQLNLHAGWQVGLIVRGTHPFADRVAYRARKFVVDVLHGEARSGAVSQNQTTAAAIVRKKYRGTIRADQAAEPRRPKTSQPAPRVPCENDRRPGLRAGPARSAAICVTGDEIRRELETDGSGPLPTQ
jgi:hypothetical protein